MPSRKLQQRPTQFTKRDIEHAAESAREMVAEDSVLQHLVNILIISRRLYMVARSAMDNEILRGWETENPDLIIQTLVLSAQEKANEKFKIMDLQQSMLQEVIPVLDVIAQQVRETGQDIDQFTTGEETTDESAQPGDERDLSGGDENVGPGCDGEAAGAGEVQELRGREVGDEASGAEGGDAPEGPPLADDGVHQ